MRDSLPTVGNIMFFRVKGKGDVGMSQRGLTHWNYKGLDSRQLRKWRRRVAKWRRVYIDRYGRGGDA